MLEPGTKTHPITLTTRTKYAIPSSKYMIPTTWARYHLSQLINKVLSSARPVPFDFLINGELLTGSLAEWCNEHSIGEEETLDIEYIESVLPPELLVSQETDDWMSSITCKYRGHFLTTSYDGCVRIHNDARETIATMSSHSGPVTSACWVAGKQNESFEGDQLVASASFDHTVHLARVSSSPNLQCSTLASLHLHTSPVSSIASSSSGLRLISAGWDSLLAIWSTELPDRDEVQNVAQEGAQRKRRKTDSTLNSIVKKAPVSILKSHTTRVSKAIFGASADDRTAYSCGWDSTVRSWDVESSVCVNTVTLPDRAHLDLAMFSSGETLVVASADRTVSLLDLRASNGRSSTKTLTHPHTPSCLAAHPTSTYHLLTGSYDGAIRVWDIRAPRTPLAKFNHTVQAGKNSIRQGKILAVDWAHDLAACAGEVGFGIWQAGVGAS